MDINLKNVVFRDIFLYFATAITVCLAAILFITSSSYWIIRYHDFADSRILVEKALENETKKLFSLTQAYATGNPAYENIVVHPDEKWFSENIGQDLLMNFGVDFSAVVNTAGHIIFTHTKGENIRKGISEFDKYFQDLIGALKIKSGNNHFYRIVENNHFLYIITIAQIKPFNNSEDFMSGQYNYLILTQKLDDELFHSMSKTFGITGLRYIKKGDELLLKDSQYLPLKEKEKTIGYLTWIPQNMAQNILTSLLPTGIAVTLLLCVIGIFMTRNVTHAASAYEEAVAELMKTSENLKEAKENAEKSDLAKSKFLATMSHEIRTPMNGIVGMISLLKETELNNTQNNYVNTIQSSADALMNMLGSILEYSKLETNLSELFLKPIDIRVLLNEIQGLLLPVALQKKLEFEIVLNNPLPKKIKTDPVRLRQILLTLATNALKFTYEGKIEISVSSALLADNQYDLIFKVSDTGVGIAEINQAILFDDFFQVEAALVSKADHTGFGLNLVRNLVNLMGGKLGVKSEIGHGSIFWFSVPVEAY